MKYAKNILKSLNNLHKQNTNRTRVAKNRAIEGLEQ